MMYRELMRSRFVVIAIILILSGIRYYFFMQWRGDPLLATHVGETISLVGVITEEPSPKEKYTQLVVTLSPGTKMLVLDDAYSNHTYGDRILVTAKLLLPENFETENGRTFDYVSYLAKDRIFYVMRYAKVSVIAQNKGNLIKANVLSLKQKVMASLNRALPYPESRLAAGLVVAGKYAIPKNVEQEFISTGTIQVVVLSGYNVTIIAEMMMLLFASLPKKWGTLFGGISIVLFAIAAGASATVVRATIMVLIALLGKSLRRTYDVGRALVASALIMLFINPMLLVFDPSFQLSFLATIGLIYLTPIVEKKMSFVPEKYNVRATLAATTATQLFVTPFLLYLTGTLSVVAVPANFLLFFVTPITMLLSFATGVLSMLSVFLTTPLRFATFIFLRVMLVTVHIFSAFPFASIEIHSFPGWCVTLVYCCFAVMLFRYSKKQKPTPSGVG